MELTLEQREDFLEFTRQGRNRQQAAEAVAEKYSDPRITATKFKFLCQRDHNFGRLFQEAVIEGKGSLVDRLERCAVEMAEGGHWPALKFLLTTYGESFQWARSSKGEVGTSIEIQNVAVILSRYLPSEMYDELMTVVEQKMIEDTTIDQIPPAVEAA